MKINILPVKVTVSLLALLISNTFASDLDDGTDSSSFYERKREGWFWYESEPESKKPEEKKQLTNPDKKNSTPKNSSSKNEVVVDVAWLRQNLPKLRDAAIDDPSYENVRRYFYAQRVMMDKASKFSSVAQEVSKFEVALDETLRRPDNQTALYDFKLGAKNSRNSVVQALSKEVGFFFFYTSSCGYCSKQAPLLQRLSKDTGINVLAISLDGRPLPNGEFPDYVTDPGTLRERLKVMVTPTIYLVKNDGSEFHNVAAGLTSPDELMRRTVMLANRQGWITEEQYNSTREVNEILLADDTKEKLYVDEEKVFSDPNYLADKLREKFQQNYRTTPQVEVKDTK